MRSPIIEDVLVTLTSEADWERLEIDHSSWFPAIVHSKTFIHVTPLPLALRFLPGNIRMQVSLRTYSAGIHRCPTWCESLCKLLQLHFPARPASRLINMSLWNLRSFPTRKTCRVELHFVYIIASLFRWAALDAVRKILRGSHERPSERSLCFDNFNFPRLDSSLFLI